MHQELPGARPTREQLRARGDRPRIERSPPVRASPRVVGLWLRTRRLYGAAQCHEPGLPRWVLGLRQARTLEKRVVICWSWFWSVRSRRCMDSELKRTSKWNEGRCPNGWIAGDHDGPSVNRFEPVGSHDFSW